MEYADIIIIGAGSAGLMAALTLANAGKKVIVLEARNRCGGRIHTIKNESFFKHAELGAEFVHGDLPVTLDLLNQGGLTYTNISGEMWNYRDGHFNKDMEHLPEWDELIEIIEKLEHDTSIDALLKKEFQGAKHSHFKKSVLKFVSGYDTANPHKASVFALLKEWKSEDHNAQHRINGGYGAMIKYMEQAFEQAGGRIYLNLPVRDIRWQQGKVNVVTVDGALYKTTQLLIAVPLGVLQATGDEQGAILFHPPIPEQSKAAHDMGFGAVIKILIEFEEPFWCDKLAEDFGSENLANLGFLLSDELVPTWWTQFPDKSAVITGWLGGPGAADRKDASAEEILAEALQSLANIFNCDLAELKDKMLAFNVVNWTKEPFTHGSYAYDTIEAPASRKVLNQSVEETIFFAGEYLYEGPYMGTVEAALTSGRDTAKRMLDK